MGSSDTPKTTTNRYQGETAESGPLSKPEAAPHKSKDSLLLNMKEEEMPAEGFIRSIYDYDNLTAQYFKINEEIKEIVERLFQPTPWDDIKPNDQVKLNRWTPHARLLIESKLGHSLIFHAWVWHILDEGVFSADPKTKWQDYGDGFEAVKLFSQFLDIVQNSEHANDDNDRTSPSEAKENRWHTPEYNKWRAVSAEIALEQTGMITVSPDYVAKFIDDNLGYLMTKPFTQTKKESPQFRIGALVSGLDANMLTCQYKARLVWTDPVKQNEQNAWYGFPFTNKVDLEQERVPGAYDNNTKYQECRMTSPAPRVATGQDTEALQTISEGKPVQLVICPGIVTRGQEREKNGRPFPTDFHLIFWRQFMNVVVPDTFDPPLEPATFRNGTFVPAP
ncbi:hypothetical protein NUW58_g1151 [Xylaria curta]|uniref:Uncharacterized protein n=1 Tax=Xylaria curta TaxID=42375 RepID=A0ACC1PP26_9PEZI|nr:hypothetical protein NUW58_g1151 [Xylaria curta]